MLVCHCKGVPCRVIKDCVRQGADDAEAVGRRCGAGTGCGGCKPLLAKLVSTSVITASRSSSSASGAPAWRAPLSLPPEPTPTLARFRDSLRVPGIDGRAGALVVQPAAQPFEWATMNSRDTPEASMYSATGPSDCSASTLGAPVAATSPK